MEPSNKETVLQTYTSLTLTTLISFSVFKFLLDIFFIYISNVIPFPGLPPSRKPSIPSSFPLLQWGCSSTLTPTPPPRPILGHLLSLHRTKDLSSHYCLTRPSSATYAPRAMGSSMCTLVGVLVPRNSGDTGLFILLFLLWGCKRIQLLGSFL